MELSGFKSLIDTVTDRLISSRITPTESDIIRNFGDMEFFKHSKPIKCVVEMNCPQENKWWNTSLT